ncbi:cobalt transport protein [Gloeothece citriformis PCC 7424]|uniref:Cobalt transport protein CbiN n=1 Tax=Gloeothece citriformis (strain PCC 7424) TaxID=65393 RepID=B7KJB8_GLOC7|nr:energy-coupling factor ABC transporter substrate-binding protein [Gloeothece citriformis]ACK72202.1 cobalt transport protein [Gloeothece citriformis PCC 7424]
MQTFKPRNGLLILGVIALTILPLLFVQGEFSGADGEAEAAIGEIQPTYQPWFKPVLELPSGEIESLLFVVQGSIGAGIIGYVIGLYKGRQEASDKDQH